MPDASPAPATPLRSTSHPRRRASVPLAASALLVALAFAAPAAAQHGHDDPNRRFLDPELDVEVWSERFESEGRDVYRAREEIVAAIGLAPGMRIADVGAGTGLFVPLFARAVGASGRVYPVEISPRFLEHLRRRADEAGLVQVEVVRGTEESIELPAASVDVVFVCDTYHHFGSPEASLASIHRALKPGGALVVVEFDRVPGKSSEWVLEHVHADEAEVRVAVERAGFAFEREPEIDALDENYMLVFRKR